MVKSGECYFMNREYKKAIEMFQASLLIYPNESDILFWVGKTMMEIYDYSHAIEYLLKSNEIKKGLKILIV